MTFRLAAKYCDEINIDHMPADMPEALEVLAERCLEIGRDPKTLLVSVGINPAWPYVGMRVKGRQRMMEQADVPAIMPATTAASGTRAEELRGVARDGHRAHRGGRAGDGGHRRVARRAGGGHPRGGPRADAARGVS